MRLLDLKRRSAARLTISRQHRCEGRPYREPSGRPHARAIGATFGSLIAIAKRASGDVVTTLEANLIPALGSRAGRSQ